MSNEKTTLPQETEQADLPLKVTLLPGPLSQKETL